VIVDAHCHAGRGAGPLTGPWNTVAPIELYLRRARAAGISRTVIIPLFQPDYAVANRRLAHLAARYPGRFICFAGIHAARDAGRVREMIAEGVGRGFRGIKIHGKDSPFTTEVGEVARDFGLPVIYDVFSRAYLAEMAASTFPDVDFVIPHLGSFSDDWRAQVQVVDQLVRYPNVYADTSGVRRFEYLVQAVDRAGPHKLVFGSDGPWLHPGVELHKVKLLGLDRADEDLVLGRNILRLIGGVRREGRFRPQGSLLPVGSARPWRPSTSPGTSRRRVGGAPTRSTG
jgi:predicted TIM-barrel fold metal-dependent hydrolase